VDDGGDWLREAGMKRLWPLLPALCLGIGSPARPAGIYPEALPPADAIETILESSPLVAETTAGIALGEALNQRRRVGLHEWTVRATTQERRDLTTQRTYMESQVALERAFRIPGKASVDAALGQQAIEIAEFTRADAWHEAGRALLAAWFDWLRGREQVSVLDDQARILEQHRDAVARRVAAGDAPAIEARLAEGELDRVRALSLEARQSVEALAFDLQELFPALSLQAPSTIAVPAALEETDRTWHDRIVADNHELELAQNQQREAELFAERAKLDRIADPTVGVHYGQERDRQEKLLGLTVTLPFGGSGRRADFAAATARARMAAERTRQVRLKVEGDANRALGAVRLTRARWEQLSRLSDQMQATASTLRRGYELGELDLAQTLAAQRQALEATLGARQAGLDAIEAYARLRLDAHEIWALAHEHAGE
jgi:cobalt-zinc-cadmium efflux system outer membrane protein